MPYIKQGQRDALAPDLVRTLWAAHPALSEGELNYTLTRLVRRWLGDNPNYARFNAALGVLEAAKLELYRRMVAPYEDTKIAENGDVY